MRCKQWHCHFPPRGASGPDVGHVPGRIIAIVGGQLVVQDVQEVASNSICLVSAGVCNGWGTVLGCGE